MSRYLIDRRPTRPAARTAIGAVGAVFSLLAWEAIAASGALGARLPTPSSIVVGMSDPVLNGIIGRALAATLPQAGIALLLGVVLGVGAALLQLLIPRAERSVHRLASLLDAVPAVILSPILVTLFGVARVPVVVGTLGVFFAVFVTTSSGFLTAPRPSADYVRTTGGSRLALFRYVQAPAALPGFVDGLRLAAPNALLGTMFGEWFGSSTGLGVLIQVSWQRFQVDLLWSAALVATALAIVLLIVAGALSRITARRFS
ncbi:MULTISPECIES: ABC transporter permease [unclassified Rathayibacter]|uniref:ABC transporter permease n=1 Tax=unclassified Rathayibacter TaxID=2609250 RepID=UPI000F4C73DF|nr:MULTISPECIES: ABC transporter permease subunit [unclassified Rathayibacter]ROP49089.1 NitT/TauT family transport system permease protein [Rathayibacter sp. PhB186]ROS50794.1 NitT/TauT family transport system permease protein [Rathayibacter sp. PhB185]